MNNNDLNDLNKLMYPQGKEDNGINEMNERNERNKNSFEQINDDLNNSINLAIDKSVEFTGNDSNVEEIEDFKKSSIIDKFALISQEDNLKQFSWLIPNKDVLGFMKKRLKKTLIATLITALLSAVFIYLDMTVLKIGIPPIIFVFIVIVVGFITFKNDYFKLKKTFTKKKNDVYNSFPLWVSTLQILIMTNNITNTFKKSIPTCPECFRSDLEEFVNKIEFDPENKEYYKNFLRRYGIEEIQEIIMDMYAFNKMDKKEIIHQFTNVNKRLNKIQNNIRMRRQEQSLFFISALNSVPILLGSLYVLVISMLLSSF